MTGTDRALQQAAQQADGNGPGAHGSTAESVARGGREQPLPQRQRGELSNLYGAIRTPKHIMNKPKRITSELATVKAKSMRW